MYGMELRMMNELSKTLTGHLRIISDKNWQDGGGVLRNLGVIDQL